MKINDNILHSKIFNVLCYLNIQKISLPIFYRIILEDNFYQITKIDPSPAEAGSGWEDEGKLVIRDSNY